MKKKELEENSNMHKRSRVSEDTKVSDKEIEHKSKQIISDIKYKLIPFISKFYPNEAQEIYRYQGFTSYCWVLNRTGKSVDNKYLMSREDTIWFNRDEYLTEICLEIGAVDRIVSTPSTADNELRNLCMQRLYHLEIKNFCSKNNLPQSIMDDLTDSIIDKFSHYSKIKNVEVGSAFTTGYDYIAVELNTPIPLQIYICYDLAKDQLLLNLNLPSVYPMTVSEGNYKKYFPQESFEISFDVLDYNSKMLDDFMNDPKLTRTLRAREKFRDDILFIVETFYKKCQETIDILKTIDFEKIVNAAISKLKSPGELIALDDLEESLNKKNRFSLLNYLQESYLSESIDSEEYDAKLEEVKKDVETKLIPFMNKFYPCKGIKDNDYKPFGTTCWQMFRLNDPIDYSNILLKADEIELSASQSTSLRPETYWLSLKLEEVSRRIPDVSGDKSCFEIKNVLQDFDHTLNIGSFCQPNSIPIAAMNVFVQHLIESFRSLAEIKGVQRSSRYYGPYDAKQFTLLTPIPIELHVIYIESQDRLRINPMLPYFNLIFGNKFAKFAKYFREKTFSTSFNVMDYTSEFIDEFINDPDIAAQLKDRQKFIDDTKNVIDKFKSECEETLYMIKETTFKDILDEAIKTFTSNDNFIELDLDEG